MWSVFCAVSLEGYQIASFLLHRKVFAIQKKQTIKPDKTNLRTLGEQTPIKCEYWHEQYIEIGLTALV